MKKSSSAGTKQTHRISPDETENIFRLALEAAPKAMLMMDGNGKIIFINRMAEKLFGYSRNELIGKNIMILIPQRLHDNFPGYWSILMNGDLSYESRTALNLWGINKNGNEFAVDIDISFFETEAGILVLSSIMDITQSKKDEEQLREAKEKAEQMSMARQEFLSVMSHEMRTPLNAVVGISHLLAEGDLTPEQEENISILQFSAQNLLSLINNILDFSKIESGMLQLEQIDFNFNQLIRRVMDSFRHNAQEKQVRLNLQTEMDIPEILNGDPARLTQVLTNLLHNAIKFTEQGEVRLAVRAVSEDTEKIRIYFEISDTGIGIENDRLEEIFDSYTQAKPSITRQFGGSGLGLTICKKLVKIMGGEIRVKSKVNTGSVFSFDLEFTLGSRGEQKLISHRHEHDFDLTGIRVLLVEDNVTNRALAKKFITRWGALVDTAENGMVAVKKVNESPYDLVLMDLQMPVMDGYKANRIIRDLGYTSEKLPVIALSAYILDEVKTKVRASGMNDYLSKPIDPHELYRKIVKNIKRKKRNENESFLITDADRAVEVLRIDQLMESFDPFFRNEFIKILEKEFNDFREKIFIAAKTVNAEDARQLIHKITPSLKRFKNETLSFHLVELQKSITEHSSPSAIPEQLEKIQQECDSIFNTIAQLKEKYCN
ncbi:MAG TPA: ATP-binding protein [Bacteroidia bacterium]|nr:ATP-binding protein [Bacteroidia bacterium]